MIHRDLARQRFAASVGAMSGDVLTFIASCAIPRFYRRTAAAELQRREALEVL